MKKHLSPPNHPVQAPSSVWNTSRTAGLCGIVPAGKADYPELLSVWEKAVRSSHGFLSEKDLSYYKELIPTCYFPQVKLYTVREAFPVFPVPSAPGDPRNNQNGQDKRDGRENPENQQNPGAARETIAAFIGLSDTAIEMLFVRPDRQGCGYGKRLLEFALREHGLRQVDVNEQNPKALRFYRSCGFRIAGRSQTDAQGKPYPILHLELSEIRTRPAGEEDLPALSLLFEESVRTLCRRDYTPEQIEAWIGRAVPERWLELFRSGLHFILAEETRTFTPVGFTSISPQGYLHSLFVRPDFCRRGTAAWLLREAGRSLRKRCRTGQSGTERQMPDVWAEVSLTARPFFEQEGFRIEKEQETEIGGKRLANFIMRHHAPGRAGTPLFAGDATAYPIEESPCGNRPDSGPAERTCRIYRITGEKENFMPLLLEGDEQESMIRRYLERSDLFASYENGLKAVCAVLEVLPENGEENEPEKDSRNSGPGNSSPKVFEIKNLSVTAEFRGCGYGRQMLRFIEAYYRAGRPENAIVLLAGTGESPFTLPFYEGCGFRYSHRLPGFFAEQYDHPIYEAGVRLIDMVYLKKEL